HPVFCKVINVVIFRRVPRVRRGNEPLEEARRRRATFVDIGIPNPESTIAVELRIGCKTEKTSLIIGLWDRIAEPRKTGNMTSEPSHLRAKVKEDFRRAVRG